MLYSHFATVVFLGDRRKKNQKVEMTVFGHLQQWLGIQASKISSMTSEKIHFRFLPFPHAII